MTVLALERHELSRWVLSAAVAIGLHAAVAMLLLWSWRAQVTGDAIGDAIVVDLSAFNGPPTESKFDLPPGPLQPQVETAPQPEPPQPEEQQRREKAELPPQPSDVTLPAEQARPVEKTDRADQPVVETAPPKIRPSAAQVTSWHRKIAEQVERHKGYPAAARARRQT